jgi:hypothetical protein
MRDSHTFGSRRKKVANAHPYADKNILLDRLIREFNRCGAAGDLESKH